MTKKTTADNERLFKEARELLEAAKNQLHRQATNCATNNSDSKVRSLERNRALKK